MATGEIKRFEVASLKPKSASNTNAEADFSLAKMEEILLSLGVKPAHVKVAIDRHRATKETMSQIMRDFSFLSGEGVAQALSLQSGLPYFPAEEIDSINKEVLLSGVEQETYQPYVPVGVRVGPDGQQIWKIAVSDPRVVAEAQSAYLRYKSEIVVASEHTIQTVYRKFFAKTEARFDKLVEDFERKNAKSTAVAGIDDLDSDSISMLSNIYFALIRHACYSGASDMYLAQSEHVGIIKLKLNGVGTLFRTISKGLYTRLLTKMAQDNVKVDELETRPKEGNIKISDQEKEMYPDIATRFNMRLEMTKSRGVLGAVIRILDRNAAATDLERLGFDPDTYRAMVEICESPTGLLIITGPTGSGKTTTMYACLKKIDPIERSVQSIENPIEYVHGLWQQYEVRKDSSNEADDYNEWLKALLRNAPDVILIGEVRDAAVAAICLSAANTGHLVMASLHTNDAPKAIYRLKDLNIDMRGLSSVLLGVLAQRLVRLLCNDCKVIDESADTQEELNIFNKHHEHYTVYKQGAGCPNCDYKGYRGRNMVYELFRMTAQIRRMLENDAHPSEIERLGVPLDKTMWACGLKLIQKGKTSLAELKRTTTRPIMDDLALDALRANNDKLELDSKGAKRHPVPASTSASVLAALGVNDALMSPIPLKPSVAPVDPELAAKSAFDAIMTFDRQNAAPDTTAADVAEELATIMADADVPPKEASRPVASPVEAPRVEAPAVRTPPPVVAAPSVAAPVMEKVLDAIPVDIVDTELVLDALDDPMAAEPEPVAETADRDSEVTVAADGAKPKESKTGRRDNRRWRNGARTNNQKKG